MSEGVNTEDLWTPYKKLYNSINFLCGSGENVSAVEFETILRRNKQTFFALLQNPTKNAKSREELKKGMEDGITVKGIGHQVLSRDLFQEVIIISDMYDLNEFVALDLLCTAQIQMPHYYGLPRGLVAVLLYYDGRKCITSTLRLLVQARKGVAWNVRMPDDVVSYVTSYTDDLAENGLFNRIFELLRNLDLNKEIEKLQENLALGGPRHRRQVIDLYNDTKQCLSEIVFLWASQCGLPKEPTISLINFLCQRKIEEDASGIIDNITFFLLMAFLAAIDLSTLHIREDGEEVVQKLPILADKNYIPTIVEEISPSKPKWVSNGLQATATFGVGVTLACLHLVPQGQELQLIDKEVTLLNTGIEMKVFEFLISKILTNQLLYTDEILQRRIHYLFTDFIIQSYSTVKELRIKANEIARMTNVYVQEGIVPPRNLPRNFENFIKALTLFYEKDPLNLHYVLDYWCPNESYGASLRSLSLFKFIRLVGDSVPSSLFVTFLNMLSSLSTCQEAAHFCFNMLKQTGNTKDTVSWDHFFMSFNQYYCNLKQEVPPISDTVYRRGVHHKGITPQEIDGLHAVLKLIRTIAEHDDFSRLALCEHPGWAPLPTLLGLVSCSVPITIKADLLFTLAALSKSPETALQVWNYMEMSQILTTIPTTSSYQPKGIQTELEEVESRMEEYPVTRSVLKLLDVLTDSGIPRTLGAGPRKPGFDPYLTFIVNSVFLKFNTRSYKNIEERWIISSMCLKLLEKFLSQYEPQLSDFTSNKQQEEFNSPPGYHLMLQLSSKSELLNLVLYIIEESLKLFLEYVSFPGKKYVEESSLLCLNLLERALVLQGRFSSFIPVSSSPVLLSNLNKLLFIINPRSGQPDYCLNICKYITFQYSLYSHALAAVKILIHITSFPNLHSQFLNILLLNDKESKLIRSGFVECLDSFDTKEDISTLTLIKEVIIKLLKQCLSYSVPNLSLFLLGFNLKNDISQTIFQQPGVLNFPRTCLHSILTLINCENAKDGTTVHLPLLESIYHVLYLLCANYKTSEPVLRFLRQHQNFFKNHLMLCAENANDSISQLNQLSWLLKTVAVELKVSCTSNHFFYLEQLADLLLGKVKYDISQEPVIEGGKLLITLINKFDLNVQEIVTPRWEYFDHNILNTLLNNCETSSNPKLIDIRKLHQTLVDEIANAAIGQRQAIVQEIQKVLLHALNVNNNRNAATAIIRFIDSWRQITEILSIYLPLQLINAKVQQFLFTSILQNLCSKMSTTNLLPEVTNQLSGVVLIVLENIWKCHKKEEKQQEEQDDSLMQLNKQSLETILNHLVKWLINADGAAQTVKINLYASLVTFLRLLNLEEPIKSIQSDHSFYVSRLDNSQVQLAKCKTTFVAFEEKLIELLCYDCIRGHDISRILAVSTFSSLIGLTGNVSWIVQFAGHGYLKHLIENILNSNEELKSILEPVPENLRLLYLNVAQLSLLSQIASTKVGSELILEQRVLSCLSNMSVFQMHPEILKQSQMSSEYLDDFIPTVENRYLQIFMPTFRLCNAIITSLSANNQLAVTQIVYYIFSHLDIVEYILRSGSPALSENFLEELSIVTALIARITKSNMDFIHQNTESIQDNRAHLYRIQKLMLELLTKFFITSDVTRDLLSNPPQNHMTFQTSPRLLLVLQIISNLLMYARNLVTNDNPYHPTTRTIFRPSLGEIFNFKFKQDNSTDKCQTLGVIVKHLINTVNYYHEEKTSLDFLERKINDIPHLSSSDIKEFFNSSEQVLDVTLMRENAFELVTEKLNSKRREFDHYFFIIDNLLYLLWVHLDYYMLRAIPKIKGGELPDLSKTFNLNRTLASASEATWKVSTDDISNLKQGLVSVFNDSFSRQLLETTKGRSDVSKQFIEVLLRKIKRLIQFVPVK